MVLAVYLLAFLLAVSLLYGIHSHPWYLHVPAIGAAFGLGFVQTPPEWNSLTHDLLFGSTITFLLVWGIGGLLPVWGHHVKHA